MKMQGQKWKIPVLHKLQVFYMMFLRIKQMVSNLAMFKSALKNTYPPDPYRFLDWFTTYYDDDPYCDRINSQIKLKKMSFPETCPMSYAK